MSIYFVSLFAINASADVFRISSRHSYKNTYFLVRKLAIGLRSNCFCVVGLGEKRLFEGANHIATVWPQIAHFQQFQV